MVELRTEEEQLAVLRNWWSENGKSLVIGVLIALVGYFGWKGWTNSQLKYAEEASMHYQNLVVAMKTIQLQNDDEKRKTSEATVTHLTQTLKQDYSDTTYAVYASLLQTRLLAENKELDKAMAEIDWALAQKPDAYLSDLLNLRKARISIAKGETDAAISLLEGMNTTEFDGTRQELLGDLYAAKGESDKARKAYELVMQSTLDRSPLVKMKLDNLPKESMQ